MAKAKKTGTKKKVSKKKATTKKTASQKAGTKKSGSPQKATKKITKKVAKKTSRRTSGKSSKKVAAGGKKPARSSGLVGRPAPDFSAPATSGKNLSLSDFKGKCLVIYFYPKDNTPGCTLEGQDFRRLHREFQKLGCEILGVSKDSVQSHEKFKSKCDFPFELLSDPDEKVCRAYDVIQMKSLYGRTFEGIVRSTFVLDRGHIVRREWRRVKVNGHAQEVLDFVRNELK